MRMHVALLTLLVTGCAVIQQEKISSVTTTGFLGHYDQLTPSNNADQSLLRYIDFSAPWSSYTKVRLEPITFWAGPNSKVPETVQQQLCDYASAKVQQALMAKGLQLVDQGGPGVVVIRAALTDASSATPVLRTISVVVPQARLLSAIGNLATGDYAFSGSLQSEGEVLDSVTGQRMAAWVDKRSGAGSIRNYDVWKWGDAENVIDFWAKTLAQRFVDLQSGRSS